MNSIEIVERNVISNYFRLLKWNLEMKCFKMHFINIKSKYADIFREIYLIYVYFRYTEHIFASNRVYIEDIHISERVRHALVQIINSQAERITNMHNSWRIYETCVRVCVPPAIWVCFYSDLYVTHTGLTSR